MVRTKQASQTGYKKYHHYRKPFIPKTGATKSVLHTDIHLNSSHAFTKPANKVQQIIEVSKKQPKQKISERVDLDPAQGDDSKKPKFLTYSIPRASFQKICRAIAFKHLRDCKFEKDALECLQLAAEDFMVGFFEDAAVCASHAGRKTLQLKDLELAGQLRKMDYEPL